MTEDVEAFRQRARAWLAGNMPRRERSRVGRGDPYGGSLPDDERVARARWLQRSLFDGGFAGLVFPKEFGGQGLTPAHQRVFAEESAGYESPLWLNTSTLAIMAPVLLEFGTEEQRRQHIPAILRGDEFWAQLLSEPTGGSDLAGALTRADRDGEGWRLNGSKVWTSGAHLRDLGMCLARTNWDVPKHEGLTVFIVDLRAPGVTIRPITQVNGSSEFCQEYFDNVMLAADRVVGEVNDGWRVASKMLLNERNAVGGGSPYAGGPRGGSSAGSSAGPSGKAKVKRGPALDLLDLARSTERAARAGTRQLIGEAHMIATVRGQMVRRVSDAIRSGAMAAPAASLLKLMTTTTSARLSTIGMELAGPRAAAAPAGDRARVYSLQYLSRQASCVAGGSSEMQRNMISERLLGMPKEPALDRDIPFREVRRNAMVTR
jgi:alkylation response protein AidB-like acyl-CoA dehydrogenase